MDTAALFRRPAAGRNTAPAFSKVLQLARLITFDVNSAVVAEFVRFKEYVEALQLSGSIISPATPFTVARAKRMPEGVLRVFKR